MNIAAVSPGKCSMRILLPNHEATWAIHKASTKLMTTLMVIPTTNAIKNITNNIIHVLSPDFNLFTPPLFQIFLLGI